MTLHMEKASSASSSESGSESDSESDDSDEERNNKVKLLEKELLALQEKMRKLVEESTNKKKAKKKIKEKQKKPITTGPTPKVPAAPTYATKANNIVENIGEFSNFRNAFILLFIQFQKVIYFQLH